MRIHYNTTGQNMSSQPLLTGLYHIGALEPSEVILLMAGA